MAARLAAWALSVGAERALDARSCSPASSPPGGAGRLAGPPSDRGCFSPDPGDGWRQIAVFARSVTCFCSSWPGTWNLLPVVPVWRSGGPEAPVRLPTKVHPLHRPPASVFILLRPWPWASRWRPPQLLNTQPLAPRDLRTRFELLATRPCLNRFGVKTADRARCTLWLP